MVKVWDPLVRIFHWSLVTMFAVAWLSSEGLETVHEWSGYIAGGLVVIRIVWGFIGPRYARFTNFIKGPRTTIEYLKDMAKGKEKRYLGHNPAGAAMIIALLVTMLVTIWTGWMLIQPQYEHSILVKGAHELITSVLMGLVILHVGGVILAGLRHRENLARAMITGEKKAPGPDDVA